MVHSARCRCMVHSARCKVPRRYLEAAPTLADAIQPRHALAAQLAKDLIDQAALRGVNDGLRSERLAAGIKYKV